MHSLYGGLVIDRANCVLPMLHLTSNTRFLISQESSLHDTSALLSKHYDDVHLPPLHSLVLAHRVQ